jgi:mannose-6-phosphate isomerase-like protein (cupin superfamily)
MMTAGDILEHPPSGARLVIRSTAEQTHGRATVVELLLEPNGYRPRLHAHPRQRQRVEILAGSAGVQEGRRHMVVGPGTRLTFAPGTPHRIWNAGDEPLQLVVETTPSLRFEPLMLALCHETRRGWLRRAAIAARYFDTMRPTFRVPAARGLDP